MIEFESGLVGFPDHRRFELVQWGGDDSPFSLLQSVDDPSLEFLVVPPNVFFAYEPEIEDDLVDELELQNPDDALLLVIVTVGERVEDSTANLMGPVVINQATRKAVQAVLSPDDYDIRAPLVAAAS